jgi:hypothetical protein
LPVTLYLDEHFGSGIITEFAQHGASLSVQAQTFALAQPRASDPEQLYFAARNRWTILTRDRDFVALHDQWHILQSWRLLAPPLRHAGILHVESKNILDDEVVPLVLAFLGRADRPPLDDRLYALATGRVWLSHHPFSEHLRRRVPR